MFSIFKAVSPLASASNTCVGWGHFASSMLMNLASSTPLAGESLKARLKSAGSVFRQVPGTFRLVWQADRRSAIAMAALTLLSAALPAAIAYVGKLIVDAVVTAARTGTS